MRSIRRLGCYVLFGMAGLVLCASVAGAQTAPAGAAPQARDGQHDFDFEAGSWKIHLKRLEHPLTGSHTWVEFDGTTVTRKLWDGAQLERFNTDGPSGHVEGLTLRLYDKESHRWSLYWANQRTGALSLPATVGEFKNGRGEFYDQEMWQGKPILVRYVWSEMTPTSAHFEQAFSDDWGKTWEVNWITDQTRVSDEVATTQ
jgi:hypothetical protein